VATCIAITVAERYLAPLVLRAALATTLAALALAAPAAADWSGDGAADVLAVAPDGRLLLYRGTGAGAFQPNAGEGIGTGWGQFTALLTGDWSGDGKPDILARASDGRLLMYRGNGSGGFETGQAEPIGSGWGPFTALLLLRDWDGDGKRDILARDGDNLLMYRGNGAGGFVTGRAEVIGAGWQGFTALFAAGDWTGDGNQDILARTSDGGLIMYRGDGKGGIGGRAQIGAGWQSFTALLGDGDFSGDGKPDILARAGDGGLQMYRGDGDGGFITGSAEQVGSGWQSLGGLMLSWDPPTPPPPAPAPPPPPSTPDGSVRLQAGIRCTPPGGRLKVNLKIRKRSGRNAARVRRVVFYIRGGARKVDRKRPYVVKLRVRRPAGSRGRVYARVVFTRPGSKKLRRKTVSRRFVMCG
jgi:hypothetical protein